jgi:hypothetical protein
MYNFIWGNCQVTGQNIAADFFLLYHQPPNFELAWLACMKPLTQTAKSLLAEKRNFEWQ